MAAEENPSPNSQRPPGQLDQEENRLWRLALLFMVLLAAALGAVLWERLQAVPYHLGAIAPGLLILAILFAVTFFLKYAFENNWIGPRGRIGIGLVIGAVLFPFSHRLLGRGYKYFSEGIAGLGAAVLYLSLWAGYTLEQQYSYRLGRIDAERLLQGDGEARTG